jgi:hypothetical protein
MTKDLAADERGKAQIGVHQRSSAANDIFD